MTMTPEPLWWKTGVIYQVYPRSFMDANGDGVGDLAGITSRLDYLAGTLGVDAVWLSPFYPSPMADFGYDVMDYTGVDPVFGNLADFEELLRQVHKRGMQIIIDFVPNHSSDQHPWFVESRRSRISPRRDWYVWADARPDGAPPNNWLSVFGGSAWEWDELSGQYYLHSFLKEQPDLNWRNPQVMAAMLDVLRTWLERGVDGFRIDVAHFIMKDPLLRDNPPKPAALHNLHKSFGPYDGQEHIYDKGHPDVHAVYQEIRRLLDAYSDPQPRFSLGEVHIFEWDKWAGYYGARAWMSCICRSTSSFWAFDGKPNQSAGRSTRLNPRFHQAPGPTMSWATTTKPGWQAGWVPRERARLPCCCSPCRGTPTLYYGDEIGMLEAVIPPEKQQDPWGLPRPRAGQGWLPHADAVGRFAQRGFLAPGRRTLAAAQRRLHPGKRHKPAQPASLPAKSLPQPAEATKSLPRLAGRRIPTFRLTARPIVSLIYASCQARRRSWLRSIFRRASTRWNIPACAQVKSSSQRRWIATGLWAKSGCTCAPKKAFWSGSR